MLNLTDPTAPTDDDDFVIDLDIRIEHDGSPFASDPYSAERVVEWLRTSGGTLGERMMKCAAANLIEA